MRDAPTSVFGLTRRRLWPIVEEAAGDAVSHFRVAVEHEVTGYAGYSAEKCIPTFRYTTGAGVEGEVTVFGKRFYEAGGSEAWLYRLLAPRGAPIPRLYGSLDDERGREILFIEYLEVLSGDHEEFVHDRRDLLDFLEAAARFNAVTLPSDAAARLPLDPLRQRVLEAVESLESMWGHATAGDLGPEFRDFCAGHADGLSRLQDLARRVAGRVADMPEALLHTDLHPENTGRRRSTGELLIYDLEFVGIGPAWYDAALWVGAPDDVRPRCLPREELARHYLECVRRAGGPAAPLERFLEQARTLWAAWKLKMLGWRLRRALDGEVDWTDDRQAGRREMRRLLLPDVRTLLDRF